MFQIFSCHSDESIMDAAVKEERKGSEEETILTTEETQAENSNKPEKAPKTNNGKGNKK